MVLLASLILSSIPPNNISVVAVHGLGGDSYSTWTRDGTNWIRDLLPSSPYFQNARILTFGYNSAAFIRPFASSTTGRTFTFAEALLSDLDDKRATPAVSTMPLLPLSEPPLT